MGSYSRGKKGGSAASKRFPQKGKSGKKKNANGQKTATNGTSNV